MKNRWSKEKVQKDKQQSTEHTYKSKDRVTRTPLKTRCELMYSGRVGSSCSTSANGEKDKQRSTKHTSVSGKVSNSCSTIDTHSVTVKRHQHYVIWKSCQLSPKAFKPFCFPILEYERPLWMLFQKHVVCIKLDIYVCNYIRFISIMQTLCIWSTYYKLFFYLNLCLSVILNSLSCSFTPISFLTTNCSFTLIYV
jgi:hypothetical protein